ncbi:MAG: V-type ATP synthase subunit F [Candidatus Andersenbacteria bacterium]
MAVSKTQIAYIGPVGAGFGFQLTGITVFESASGEEMLATLRHLVREADFGIVFVDEGLASPHLEVVAKLNAGPLPAIILLPNPANPQNVAAQNLQQLMVRAIGSDIFESK